MGAGFGVSVVGPVDTSSNVACNLPLTDTLAGFACSASCNDAGSLTGTRSIKDNYSSDDYRIAVGRCTPIFDYNFNGAAQATGQWKCLFTTMTMTEGSGSVLCNANSTATTTTGCALATWAYFKLQGGAELYAVANAIIATGALEAGQVMELGLFLPTATTAPADGVYFRLTSGTPIGVVNYNGTETPVNLTGVTLTAGVMYRLGINVTTSLTEFWVNDVLAGSVATPSANGVPFSSVALPYCFQQRNNGAVSGAQAQLKVMAVHIEQDDLDLGMPYSHVLSAAGQCGYQGQEGGTVGSTAIFPATTVAATAAVPNNTTAIVTGLGGTFTATWTAAQYLDGLMCDFAVPAGGVSQVPRKFVCTGVQVQGVVTTVFPAAAGSFAWSVAFGHTAISLATTESASFATGTTKAPRKIAIGVESYLASAPLGTLGSSVPMELDLTQSPIVVNPGEHIALVARQLQAALASGAVTYQATFKGYWV